MQCSQHSTANDEFEIEDSEAPLGAVFAFREEDSRIRGFEDSEAPLGAFFAFREENAECRIRRDKMQRKRETRENLP